MNRPRQSDLLPARVRRLTVWPARALLGLLLVSLLMTGCASLRSGSHRPSAGGAWPTEYAALQQLDEYSLSGRIAVAAGEQGFSGSLRFQQDGPRSDLTIDGPLGIGGLHIDWDGQQLEVVTSRGERLDGEAARAELERRLGFSLPLAEMRYWLLGVASPDKPAETEFTSVPDQPQRVARLRQSDWAIEYSSFGETPPLPSKLTARRAGARVRIAIDRWMR